MTQIGKSNVKWSEIRDALNRNGGSVSNKAEDAFKVSSKYQKWARWKPVIDKNDFLEVAEYVNGEWSSNWYLSQNNECGITIPVYYSSNNLIDAVSTVENMDDLWIVNPPTGGKGVAPFRLGDFANHDLESKIINNVYTSAGSEEMELTSISVSFNFCDNRNPSNSGEGNINWLDVRDFWLNESSGFGANNARFGFIAYNGSKVVARSLADSIQNSVDSSGWGVVLQIFFYANILGSGDWNIYPVIFYGTAGTELSYDEHFSCEGITPLPCKPLSFKVLSLSSAFSGSVDSVQYSGNIITVNGVINSKTYSKWISKYQYPDDVVSSDIQNPLRILVKRTAQDEDQTSIEYTLYEPQYSYTININKGDNSYSIKWVDHNFIESGYMYDFHVQMVCERNGIETPVSLGWRTGYANNGLIS